MLSDMLPTFHIFISLLPDYCGVLLKVGVDKKTKKIQSISGTIYENSGCNTNDAVIVFMGRWLDNGGFAFALLYLPCLRQLCSFESHDSSQLR